MKRESRDMRAAARQYDAIVAQADAGHSRRKVWRRLETSTARPRRPQWRIALVAAVATVLVGLAVWRWAARADIEGYAVSGAHDFAASVAADATIEVTAGEARLTDHDATLEVRTGTRLRREARGVFLARGQLGVSVRHRERAEAPWQVRVAGGAIEVLGTRFDVDAAEGSGSVTLHEGSIRFVGASGRVTILHPGETYAWPEAEPAPAVPEPEPEPAPEPVTPVLPQKGHPTPRVSAKPTIDTDAVLERVAALRDRRQYEEALNLLATTKRASAEAVTRERLSYEMGLILVQKLGDPPRACAHLARHLHDFPNGRYSAQIREQQTAVKCQ